MGQWLAIRVSTGKARGTELAVLPGERLRVGRADEVELTLHDELVSREHAVFYLEEGDVVVQDMGSANGTFVNGKKVATARLQLEDCVLLGRSLLEVVSLDKQPEKRIAEAREARRRAATVTQTIGDDLWKQGSLEEVPLRDLLQLFGALSRSGVLVLSTPKGCGTIYMTDGEVIYASIDMHPEVYPLKALYRMLSWERGQFLFEDPETEPPRALDVSVQAILTEGLRQVDELAELDERLPLPEETLQLGASLAGHLSERSAVELEILQMVSASPTVESVFDNTSVSDLETARALLRLVEDDHVRVGAVDTVSPDATTIDLGRG